MSRLHAGGQELGRGAGTPGNVVLFFEPVLLTYSRFEHRRTGSFRDPKEDPPMKIQEILEHKGRDVVTIGPDPPVAAAIRLLVRHGIGSVVVMRDGELLGILTERDVLRLADRDASDLATLPIHSAMTREVIVGSPDDEVPQVMDVMTANRVRHLPIVKDGTLHGLISIGDVVSALRWSVESENQHLRDYVQGMVR
jgi:CBS domain-containing protein